MLTFTEALERMHQTMRDAGYPAARIEVHIGLPDVDAVQREEIVARAIIDESLHPNIEKTQHSSLPYRRPRPLAVISGVFVYTESPR